MHLKLDPSSSVPIYSQVVDQIKALVASRALRPGDRLPSVRDLAVGLRVNRNTAARAYQMLEIEKVIETRRGDGSFIAAGTPVWTLEERRRRLEVILDRAVVEAFHLGIPFEEVANLLAERTQRYRVESHAAGRQGQQEKETA
jgi:GntR family transcriptional regulator